MIQVNTLKLPRTLMEAMRLFSDLDTCEAYLMSIRWPDGNAVCPKCGCANAKKLATRAVWQCKEKGCRSQFRLKAGTIFQDSPLGLDKWFVAAWMLGSCRNGISSCELARVLGVKQTSAWHMLHRLRSVVKPAGGRKLAGTIESDESYVGGLLRHMHQSKRSTVRENTPFGKIANREVVHAFLERGGELRAFVIPRNGNPHIHDGVRNNVESGANLYTDASACYRGLASEYIHECVNHYREYVRGNVHVNGLECFFSCLRRSIKGTYVGVEAPHLEAYCDEQAYRYTYRKDSEWRRFDRLMHRVIGKRMTYSELTGGKVR